MATRIIKTDGDPVLRKKSRVVEKIDDRISQLLDDMNETMVEADGVGLAAPQIGILKRIVIIDVGDGPIEMINPEIVEYDGEQFGDEGCLSVPGKFGKVRRPNWVRVKFQGRDGKHVELEGTELFARAVFHELDHLDGVLFTDKVEGEIEE
ncbi:peptide deformylase [Peptoclostridium litorale DSM 5388]|uniref:Peptide deformylase n=1 Tax=Peptoclostridium litorale DSM 5388 TaxID=1121324 RepID=A0A069RB61_PEPLI|nr:peptide deformylase [Peptoclostridium litorale]KDR94028.1 peptide deformylase Def [Peptoclostridium litorale DSM 5388]SIN79831.1 peptide deformylase [Peptoclostridium litorale DSM 5388]